MTVQASDGRVVTWLMAVPVPLFAAIMGLSGLGLAWRRAAAAFGWPEAVAEGLLATGAALFAVLLVLYGVKALRHWPIVVEDFHHPVRVNFFACIAIDFMLIAAAALPYAPEAAAGLWFVGISLQLTIAVTLTSRWISGPYEIRQINPAWFIPVVGNIIAPFAGVALGYPELAWFFFAVGLLFWLMLFPVLLYRLVFQDDLPPRLYPTLFILMAPASVGFIAYHELNHDLIHGEFDIVARVLVYTAFFIALLLASLVRRFLAIPFSLTWWAYTFPSANLAAAAVLYHGHLGTAFSGLLAQALMLAATLIVLAVAVRTVLALIAGTVFVPDR